MKKKQKSLMIMAMIFSLIFLMTASAIAAKTGAGGEGGIACPTDVVLQYQPPAYTGYLNFRYIQGSGNPGDIYELSGAYFDGTVVQKGNRTNDSGNGCQCFFPRTNPYFYGSMDSTVFDNLTEKDLVGSCRGNTTYTDASSGYAIWYCNCPENSAYYKISTVNHLEVVSMTSDGQHVAEWQAYVEIMLVNPKK